jgi:zinc D-Ala-D-Ala dipeptidase
MTPGSLDPGMEALVEITPERHGVLVELAYASEKNFTGQPIYANNRCWVHRDLEPKLRRAAELTLQAGFRLKLLDAYRPPQAHEVLCGYISDPRYIADPKRGSNHSRGTAVDVTLVDADGRELDMGTPFDAMEEASHHSYRGLPEELQGQRSLLLDLMTQAGFQSLDEEWWHYQLPEARSYPLIRQEPA